MSKTMLIDAAHAEETRVVVLDGHRVEEFDFESQSRKQLRGNIYLAKVTRVEPSLQAAFIEYGGNRHGFLAFNEIHPDYFQIPVADREALMRELAEEEDDDVEASGEDDDDAELPVEEARLRRKLMRKYKIQEVIRRRQILLVQVVKEERGTKGAALTTYLSLAGRYCVLMPNTARGGGISRKITNAADRKRLKAVANSLDVPNGMGLIIRTAGAKRTKQEIRRDYDYLLRLWENIRETTLKSIAPNLIYEEEDLVKRAIRDLYDKDVEAVLVDGEESWKEARDFMRMLMPSQAKKVQLYKEPTPLFVRYKVEDLLSQIHSPVVPLKSGGYLVINQTEALVAVDVNSGKSTRERNIEATALKTNLEAAEEAARQLRLRDLAGLVVIDFIDMEESKNNRAVEKKLKDCLKDDRARIQMGKISPFGLMEISRQRRRTGVLEGSTHVCEHCQGQGRVRSVESSALAALRAAELESVRGGAGAVTIRVCTAVALYILNEKRAFLERLRDMHDVHVTVLVDEDLHQAEHAIDRTLTAEDAVSRLEYADLSAARARPKYVEDDEDEIEDEEDEDDLEASEDAEEDEAPARSRGRERDREEREEGEEGRRNGRRRRRRRRGGRGDDVAVEKDASTERASDEADSDDEDYGSDEDRRGGRRRRRGRRGGRRMRDEGRPRDVYAWTRARTPSLEEPYVWVDPLERLIAQDAEAPRAGPAQAKAEAIAPAAPALEAPEAEATEAAAPKKTRARRGRGKAAEAAPAEAPIEAVAAEDVAVEAPAEEPVADVAAEPEAEASAKKARKPRARKKADAAIEAPAEAVAEPAPVEATPEPAFAPQPEPVREPVLETVDAGPAEPDPNEITAPPAKPKRGWWRRG